MVARQTLQPQDRRNNYFAGPKALEFIPSGSKILDLALGGGWIEDRIVNIIGDKSTGKTLLATEACANFAIKHTKGKIRYRECERAWDNSYAEAIGMPMDRVDFGDTLDTVEELFNDLLKIISKAQHPELCVVDSLDSLSDQAEMARGMDEGTYGTNKARNLSQLFRRLVRALAQSHVTLMIISQVRSKIGPTLGRKTTRSGGRALDFYASQVLYLSHIETLNRTISGVKRATGIRIRAKCDKNKVSLPFREADFPILFGYGIDDAESCIGWLKECKSLDSIGLKDGGIDRFLRDLRRSSNGDFHDQMKRIHQVVTERWYAIENTFLPTRKKYGL